MVQIPLVGPETLSGDPTSSNYLLRNTEMVCSLLFHSHSLTGMHGVFSSDFLTCIDENFALMVKYVV